MLGGWFLTSHVPICYIIVSNLREYMNHSNAKNSCVMKALGYAHYAIAGAIGGISVYKTGLIILALASSQNAETTAMTAGALLAVGLVKVFKVV